MAIEQNMHVGGVAFGRGAGSESYSWVRFTGDARGWMKVSGEDKEDTAAMFGILVAARFSNTPVAVNIYGGFLGQFFIDQVYG